MKRNLLLLTAIAVMVFTMTFSFTTTVNQAEAGPCNNCWGFCACQGGQYWEGHWGGGVCNLNACQRCNGEGVNCW